MSYEYRDQHDDFVQVQEHEDGAWIIINQGRGGAAVTLDLAEAQRFADAVLDAAIAYESRKREQHEAEEANVRTFRVVNLALDSGTTPNNIYDDWDDISELAHENWRTRYRAHRKFFKEETA